jgi:hypothetical protein
MDAMNDMFSREKIVGYISKATAGKPLKLMT